MGIPHLTRHLSPHATKLLLPRQGKDRDFPEQISIHAIIDGPSLAYHIYYLCLGGRAGARNALEAAPPYRELGEAAISWLQQVEQYGVKM